MDLSKIKNLIKQNGDKFILMEGDEPEVVLMSFQEYEKMVYKNGPALANNLVERGSRVRVEVADIEAEKLRETEVIMPQMDEAPSLPLRLEDIRLEDLPI